MHELQTLVEQHDICVTLSLGQKGTICRTSSPIHVTRDFPGFSDIRPESLTDRARSRVYLMGQTSGTCTDRHNRQRTARLFDDESIPADRSLSSVLGQHPRRSLQPVPARPRTPFRECIPMSEKAQDDPIPDWRDPSTYDYTRHLTREGWAWEFLRRNPTYRATWSTQIKQATLATPPGAIFRAHSAAAAPREAATCGLLSFRRSAPLRPRCRCLLAAWHVLLCASPSSSAAAGRRPRLRAQPCQAPLPRFDSRSF